MYPSKQAISSIPSRNYYSRGKIPEKARNKNLSSSNVGATMPEISQEMNPTQQNCHFLKHELELPRQRCLLIHHPTPPRTLLEWKVENQVSQDALPQYDDAIMVPGPEGTGRGGYQFGQRKLNRPGEETNTLGRRRRIPNRERRERERSPAADDDATASEAVSSGLSPLAAAAAVASGRQAVPPLLLPGPLCRRSPPPPFCTLRN
jgi:hypothetical protein